MTALADPFSPAVLRPVVDPNVREWRLVIPGDVVPKGRGRIMKLGNHMGIQTPIKTRRYEDIVRQTAVREWNRPLLADTAIFVTLKFYRAIAASWSKRKTQEALYGTLRPIGRPDLDNMVKSITDGLNGVVYLDDSAIVETHSSKHYATTPRVEIILTW